MLFNHFLPLPLSTCYPVSTKEITTTPKAHSFLKISYAREFTNGATLPDSVRSLGSSLLYLFAAEYNDGQMSSNSTTSRITGFSN